MKRLFVFILLIKSCTPYDLHFYTIDINNKYNASIYYYLNLTFPDTLLPIENKYIIKINKSSFDVLDSEEPWSKKFSKIFPKDTLQIFFFNADTIAKYDWEYIRKNYKIMERRVYSKSDLEKNNWQINYP